MEFREHLYEAGGELGPVHYGASEGELDSDDELQWARRRVETEGQRFRRHLMTQLFDSTHSGAERR